MFPLKIHIKKSKNKPSILTCIRTDNTTTYSKLYPNLEIHDIAHFIVESHLQYKNAFYGLLAQGFNIQDFELPIGKRPEDLIPKNLAPEALTTEHIVNLLQVEYINSKEDIDFIKLLTEILKGNQLPFPNKLTNKLLSSIRKDLLKQMNLWNKMGFEDHLQLVFNPS